MNTILCNFTIFTILGATGDLVDKKIIPSIYTLFSKGLISKDSIKIIAFARRDFTNGKYKEIIDHSLQTYGKVDLSESNLGSFYDLFEYHQGNFDRKEDFVSLANKINEIQDKKGICAQKSFYLAVPTDLYDDVIDHILGTQLQDLCSKNPNAFSQLIIEKPFGKNLESSTKLDACLKKLFKEDQIFRIDHYMGKEIIEDIINFRKNNLTDKWNKDFIKQISISTVENLGVEKRGAFFDSVGSLLDVGQSHLIELLSVLAMDLSQDSDFNYQPNRAAIINKLKIYGDEDIKKYTYRAQYKGYKEIENVKKDSNTETYFKVAAFINDSMWENVPFFLESGKRCGINKKEIIIEFKDGTNVTFEFSNETKITIDGKEINDVSNSADRLEEYATLFNEALQMKRDNFISIDEIKGAWEFIDSIRNGWDRNVVPLNTYKPDDPTILKNAKTQLNKQ